MKPNKYNIFNLLKYNGIETRKIDDGLILSLNETTTEEITTKICDMLSKYITINFNINVGKKYDTIDKFDSELRRNNNFLNQHIFRNPKSETEMLRYINYLSDKDYSLVNGMIPLGSCTMKLNATTQMLPLSWDTVQNQHPFQVDKPYTIIK